MFNLFSKAPTKLSNSFSRRDLLKRGGLLSVAAGAAPVLAEPALADTTKKAAADAAHIESTEMYEAIGVHPVINSRGTFTIISGSQTLPK